MTSPTDKPLIGISMGLSEREDKGKGLPKQPINYLKNAYSNAILDANGIAIPLVNKDKAGYIQQLTHFLHGLILTGGGDFLPEYYGEKDDGACESLTPQRDAFEFEIYKKLREMEDFPILGICRGMQIINAAEDGAIYQDIDGLDEFITHRGPAGDRVVEHEVLVTDDSSLKDIIGKREMVVDSSHHQAIKGLGDEVKTLARSKDGLAEAIEVTDRTFVWGVQWHPERKYNQDSKKIFAKFIEQANKYRKAR